MFQKIEGKNLFSWEQLEYIVVNGVSQITGFNHDDGTPEGSGKSSIVNILCWVLFGEIPKDAKIDEVIREGCKSGEGTVTLYDDSKIFRSRKPNVLKIVTKDGQNIQGKDAKETQLLINKRLGSDFNSFCQSIYFSQNYPKKFVSASEPDKAKILSEIQDLSIFDRARKYAQEEQKSAENNLTIAERDLAKSESILEGLESNKNLLTDFIQNFKEMQTYNIGKLQTKYNTLQEQAIKLDSELESILEPDNDTLSQLQNMIAVLGDKQSEFKSEILNHNSKTKQYDLLVSNTERLETKLKKLKDRIEISEHNSSECPTCGSSLSKEQCKTVFKELERQKEEYSELEAELKDSKKELKSFKKPEPIEKTTKLLQEIKEELTVLQKTEHEYALDAMHKEQKRKDILRVIKEMQVLEEEIDTEKSKNCLEHETKLVDVKEKITDIEGKIKNIKAAHTSFASEVSASRLLKDGFKEVKSYIFKSLLAELSKKATIIAQDLFEVPIIITFTNEDEDGGVSKIKTEVTLDGQSRSLGLYSGGQYARIEFAVDLALAKIMANRNINPINFRIFDEPFKNMSETSMTKAIGLLETLKGSTILIEHNSIAKSIVQSTFHVDYRDGVSRHAS